MKDGGGKSLPHVKVILPVSLAFNFPFHLKLLYWKWILKCDTHPPTACSVCLLNAKGKNIGSEFSHFPLGFPFFCFNYRTPQAHTKVLLSLSIVRRCCYLYRKVYIHFPNYNPIIVHSSRIVCKAIENSSGVYFKYKHFNGFFFLFIHRYQ